jgi:hypothetical protein
VVKRCAFDAQGPLFEPHFPQVFFCKEGCRGLHFFFFLWTWAGPSIAARGLQISFARRGAAGCHGRAAFFLFFYGRGPAHQSPQVGDLAHQLAPRGDLAHVFSFFLVFLFYFIPRSTFSHNFSNA